MKSKSIDRKKWRRLDNSAKLFPILANKKFSNVYRISVILREKIDPRILQKALTLTLERYNSFKVKSKKGFFWYYFEENSKQAKVTEEKGYPCKWIDPAQNQDYVFKVTYYDRKINLEMFHSVTDGNSALEFLKAICYQYLELKYAILSEKTEELGSIEIDNSNTEDSYRKYYKKHLKNHNSTKKAYILKGKPIALYGTYVTHFQINLKQMIKTCRKKKVTVTQYITAMLLWSIYEAYQKKDTSKKPIKICIPVNLKKYFESTTITNFFSYITIEADLKKEGIQDFDTILEWVKEEFHKKLTKEEITRTMSSNVKIGNNLFIRMIPLFLKRVTLKISYSEIAKYTTTTFSNLGKIHVKKQYEKEIEQFLFLVAPEKAEKIKCGACSYGDSISFTITTILQDRKVENTFKEKLKQENIPVETYTNVEENKKQKSLYPKVMNSQKTHVCLKILACISVLIGCVSWVVNHCVGTKFPWSWIVMVSLIYTWVTILYAIKKNTNIAFHVLVQTICTSCFVFLLDCVIGYRGWSVNFALPIIMITANFIMLVLMIWNRNGYLRYAIYQFSILLLSVIPIVLLFCHISKRGALVWIALGMNMVTTMITVLFYGKEMKEELQRRFHF